MIFSQLNQYKMKSALPPLHLICGSSDGDQSMQYIEIKKGIATAMNGQLTAQMNLNHYSGLDTDVVRKLNGKKIHRDIWEHVCDALIIDVTDDLLHYERGGVRADFDISCDFTFPDYLHTIQNLANSQFESKTFISFKPEWITLAKKLFPDRDLIIRFYQSNNQMIVFPVEKGTPKGFIAFEPNNVDDENTNIDFSLS